MNIPFSDIAAVNRFYGWALKEAYNRVAARGYFILGPEGEAFEEEWAAYCGRKYAVGVGNGTDAISFMLRAYGIGRGDKVAVPAHTCIATWMAVSAIGAAPVPVDVGMDTFNIEPMNIPFGTKAILAVHMYGRPADMNMLRQVAYTYKIPLLVDAAQAHGIKGEFLGDSAAFSFYPTKNLGALGDGGAVVTDSEDIWSRIRHYRNLGSANKDVHLYVASNSRLDELQAAFLRAKLPMLDASNIRRARNANLYGLGKGFLNNVWHQAVTFASSQRDMRRRLSERGIQTMIHYPTPPHLQPAYAHLGHSLGDFPVAERIARHGVSLPCGPELSSVQACYIRDCLSDLRVAA